MQNSRYCSPVFETGNTFLDCVVLIDISRVCRRWREIALADPTLWATLYVSLNNPSARSLHRAIHYANACLGRSKNLPLTCYVSISCLDLLSPTTLLVEAVGAHEERWERAVIDIVRPSANRPHWDEFGRKQGHLQRAGTGHLKELRLSHSSWFTYDMTVPCPALEILRLFNLEFPRDLSKWLSLSPNLLELEVTVQFGGHNISSRQVEEWHTMMAKLQVVNVPMWLLPLLTCPALDKIIIRSLTENPDHLNHFVSFVKRNAAPLRALEIQDMGIFGATTAYGALPRVRRLVRPYLLPTIKSLTLSSPSSHFLDLLSKRGDTAVCLLPSLEHLELVGCEDIGRFAAIITLYWNLSSQRRVLKSVKLTQCFKSVPNLPLLVQRPGSDDLAELPEEWQGVAQCVKDGLVLELVR